MDDVMVDATAIARRSDALYYDTRNMQRRQLCDKVARLEAEVDALRAMIGRLDENHDGRDGK